ncbi:calcium/sodium antiporter [Colwellia sp. 1_MG-2023]|uniref:calcium/sodium antiporter n=1 Tax=unclassified Colwellia TaxID=196834 RepID=UPI001C08B563|nr:MULTISPECIES: calcium/sodium antiporter [unclassified Colwellia]MBU2925018.1 calcium/sodium antiporter [Colwellia sp. C2M11]MDO6486423.1 calcium/sodium antiporter [Colwellia sp. 6_MG-2023]MDO6651689.1 calcium/sodium antiporter [Colwellia sp. 3_MG-2023]MDO6664913.1 calcium/sodium antiporter [Colwellia sp. 2_MG-2023]MDO6689286.1 calcium/sodium antiporter [Colwellia sp. 1_MG-2023]
MLEHVGILLIALTVLVWSADKFVLGASSLARNIGVSPMIIGLTIVAMGSSAPEMMVAAAASLQGSPDTAIGNAVGSNITNIALVLGLSVLIKPLMVSSSTIKQELPLLLLFSLVAYWMISDNFFSLTEGIILMVSFFGFISILLIKAMRQRKANKIDDPLIIEAEQDIPEATSTSKSIFWLIAGIVLLVLSAHFLVDSSIFIAKAYGISDLVIGLTIIAIGTSLPELAASIASILKKEDDLAMGNIVGSNLFNILAVLPFAGIIAPGPINPEASIRDIPIMLAITGLLFLLCFSRKAGCFRLTRIKGALLLMCFCGYQALLYSQTTIN